MQLRSAVNSYGLGEHGLVADDVDHGLFSGAFQRFIVHLVRSSDERNRSGRYLRLLMKFRTGTARMAVRRERLGSKDEVGCRYTGVKKRKAI